ncbi:hypothetical protein OG21DRAFT_1587857, partial [Imleria badia]
PFTNATIWQLLSWFYNSTTQKSLDDLNNLVHNVILADNFKSDNLHKFNARRETKQLDNPTSDTSRSFSTPDSWHTTSIPIRLPCDKVKQAENIAPEFHVEGLHYRKITEVVKSAFEEPAAHTFHHTPYKLFWQPDKTHPPERVITELYTSDAMLEEYEKINSKPPEVPGCNLEMVIAAIMLWSDSTHLASFGNATLWPVYLLLGNQSKYTCAKPSSFAAHHLAYIPKLPDQLQDFYMKMFGTSATAAVLTHCKHELMQAIWFFLLDSDFVDAYENGIVIKCLDGILHRVFLRLFTYVADYPEKAVITRIGFSSPVQSFLASNVFSERLSKFGFNFYSMLVPDFMHEFELGVWKATITHLIRILFKAGEIQDDSLLQSFRLVPTFGRDMIRTFRSNVSNLAKLAARDYKNILQCAIPVLDGLLPNPYNSIILDLLFELAMWHAFGKLRMHTETTLFHFENSTIRLGHIFRKFSRDCCAKFKTYDLPRETAARVRRKAQHAQTKQGASTSGKAQSASNTTSARKTHNFNMSTYKLHALGDYVASIWRYGTTDNYSTQVGELEHRRVKRFYSRTNKNAFTHAIAKHQQRERLLHRMHE